MNHCLILLAIAMQSVGKVLYGTLLTGISTPLFVLMSILLTVCVFLSTTRFQLPRRGRGLLMIMNIWTAIGFTSIFFALKFLPPAMFAAIEIGISLLTAIALTSIQNNAWPRAGRVLACAGIILGCALLSWTEVAVTTGKTTGALVWIAIGATVATGVTSALSTTACKRLATMGWSAGATLAHRFYLTLVVACIWLTVDQPAMNVPDVESLAVVGMVGMVVILVPLLLLQIALRRTDELTLLICMAAQPILSFTFSIASPAYAWNTLTLLGVLTVSLFVGLDIYMRPSAGRAGAAKVAPAARDRVSTRPPAIPSSLPCAALPAAARMP